MANETPTVPEKICNYGSPYVISRGNMWRFTDDMITWDSVAAQNHDSGDSVAAQNHDSGDKAVKLVGSIDCYQESCPCVFINVYELDENDEVIMGYEEQSRWHNYTSITFEKDGKWWEATYIESKLGEIKEIDKPVTQDEKLTINDSCNLLTSLEYEMSGLF